MYSIYLFCLLVSLALSLPPVDKFEARPENFQTMSEVRDYLKQYSDFEDPQDDKEFWETDSYKESLKSVKAELGLEETAEITDEFLDLMKQERCGLSEAKRTNEYSAVLRWSNPNDITYCFDFDNMHPSIPVSTQVSIFESALRDWQSHSKFRIRKVPFPKVWRRFYQFQWACGIAFRFAPRQHDAWHNGKGYDFDGRGRVLAHATMPQDGDIHFDLAEPWGVSAAGGKKDLPAVTRHEIGHSLGLGHSRDRSSMMYAIYKPGAKLTRDDILGIQALYGRK